jgi:2'-5' RNA ligase
MDGRSVGEGIAVAQQIGGAITDPPFEVISSKAMSFGAGRKRPLVLGCSDGAAAALTGLRDRLCDHAEAAGFHVGGSSFTPHMTLAYGGKAIPDTVLDEPVRWPARELVLVCSLQGLSKYIVMGRWAFRSRPN